MKCLMTKCITPWSDITLCSPVLTDTIGVWQRRLVNYGVAMRFTVVTMNS